MTTTITSKATPYDQLTALRMLAAGKDFAFVAAAIHLPAADVRHIGEQHGYPDQKKMAWAADVIQHDIDNDAVASIPQSNHAPAPRARVANPPPRPTPPAVKPDPYVTALPIGDLFPDPIYQRPLDQLRVQRMAKHYDIALVGIVEVSKRADGRHAILDGQHRWATIRDRAFGTKDENPHIACRVHQHLTITEEAQLYHRLNTTRKQLTGWDRWLARRGAKEPAVLEIEACVARHGCVIGMQAGGNVLRATKACENVVAIGGIALLDEVLDVIRVAYQDDQNGLDAAILYGLGQVLQAYSRTELDVARLIDTLTGILPRQLVARAAAVRELHKGTMDRLTGHVIVDRYNATKGPKVELFFDRVKPLSKNKQDSTARQNAAIKEWAERSGISLPGKYIPRQVREAYADAHVDEAAIERRITGDRSMKLSTVEKDVVVARMSATGTSLAEIERHTGINVQRHRPRTEPVA